MRHQHLGGRRHLGVALETNGFRGMDAQNVRAKPQRGEGSGINLLIDLLATDAPVVGQVGGRNVRLGMGLQSEDSATGVRTVVWVHDVVS
jgi:hypothetical protein